MCKIYNNYVFALCGHEATASQIPAQLRVVALPCPPMQDSQDSQAGSKTCEGISLAHEDPTAAKAVIHLLEGRLCARCRQARDEEAAHQQQNPPAVFSSAGHLARMAALEGVADQWMYARLAEALGGRVDGGVPAYALLSLQSSWTLLQAERPGYVMVLEQLRKEKRKKDDDNDDDADNDADDEASQ
ncbi:hypothetical protein SCUCBS95973_009898 [Sporothrix curviconia]|uniref:Uncharacterized protein n=1 Tax=Sporothrix curviconia TaxID=1260050 RepID=A0ABP0CYP1_9PEZI